VGYDQPTYPPSLLALYLPIHPTSWSIRRSPYMVLGRFKIGTGIVVWRNLKRVYRPCWEDGISDYRREEGCKGVGAINLFVYVDTFRDNGGVDLLARP
jgi:hypothetical protein